MDTFVPLAKICQRGGPDSFGVISVTNFEKGHSAKQTPLFKHQPSQQQF